VDYVACFLLLLKKGGNFQSRCEHRVPPCKKAQGWRLSTTFRADSGQVEEPKKEDWNPFISIGEECYVGMRPAKNLTKELIEELFSVMEEFGTPDKTKVFGKEFENKGRKVLELSFKGGQTYTYGGKTTSPGQAFGKETLKFLQEEELFGESVKIEDIWAHMVFYPTPDCQLAWHRDNENGLNPHAIISLTLLEDPKLGVRSFSVRLLSDKERNKKIKK
jgi:alkylated DNA repair dioxygenase AlkB